MEKSCELVVTMEKIDAHLHIGYNHFDEKKIWNYIHNNHIKKVWLLSWEEKSPLIPSLYESLPVENILEVYNRFPEIVIPFYAPDPSTPELRKTFEKYLQKGIKGCGELKVSYKWEDDNVDNYLKILDDFHLPLVFHMEMPRYQYILSGSDKVSKIVEKLLNGAFNGVSRYYLEKTLKHIKMSQKFLEKNRTYFPGYLYDFNILEKKVRQYKNITFIGHGPHFWNNISKLLREKYIHQKGKIGEFGIIDGLLEQYDNFFCDISGKSGYNALSRDPGKARIFLEKHYKKILFGSDNTGYDLIGLLKSMHLEEKKLRHIFFKNAFKIMGNE